MQTALLLQLFQPLVVLLLPLLRAASSAETNARIVGGTTVDIGTVPYLVNLRRNGAFICGGTLITPTHVLSAAHCVKGVSAKNFVVIGGANLLSEKGVSRQVLRVFTPKAYNAHTLHNDVAVLKLTAAMIGPKISTIGLCDTTFKAGELIKVSGWGQTTEHSNSVSRHVRSIEVPLVSRASCASQYKLRSTITQTMFCAAVPGVKDACDGDSGGPAIYNGKVCGIVSWGLGCARRNYPGVYTNVKTVRNFIDKALAM